jgi:tetratricopeptide (TPR) repeat protein
MKEGTNILHPLDPAVKVPFAWGDYNFLKRDWEEALRGFQNVEDEVVWNNEARYEPKLLFIANTYNAKGDRSKALEHYQELRRKVEILRNKFPDQPRYRAILGRVYARMGEHELAIQEGEIAIKIVPYAQDANIGSFYKFNLAEIYAWSNKPDEALDILDQFLSTPSHAHNGWIQKSHDWDPLQNHPRFKELVSESCESTGDNL